MRQDWMKELSRCVSWEEVNDLVLEYIKDPDEAEKIINRLWASWEKVIKDVIH